MSAVSCFIDDDSRQSDQNIVLRKRGVAGTDQGVHSTCVFLDQYSRGLFVGVYICIETLV